MSEQIIYCCSCCEYYFRSTDKSVDYFVKFICAVCGEEHYNGLTDCNKCSGKIILISVPICPKCESKEVEMRGSINSLV